MRFQSLEPFVPAGADMERSKQLFLALGFNISWEGVEYIGFEKDGCRFILQHFDKKEFAENFMISITMDDVSAFYSKVIADQLPEKFGIRINPPHQQPYGLEVNMIDIAGVCWHFVQNT